MRKVFISQPMRDREEIDIINERDAAISELEETLGEPVAVIQSYLPSLGKGKPLESLGKAIQLLADADTALFCSGWEDARGCRIEHECAVQYGIEVIER